MVLHCFLAFVGTLGGQYKSGESLLDDHSCLDISEQVIV